MNIEKEIWHKIILKENITVAEVIQNLEEMRLKIVLIVNENGSFIGSICDGDVRRGLLKGLDIKSNISEIINRDALVVPIEMKRSLVKQLMIVNKIQQIPVVDQTHNIIGLHLWDDILLPKVKGNTMVIMAGGKGIRLRPQTEKCPKPMLLVKEKPMLEHIILSAKSEGFSHFIIAINYLGHMIEDHFGNGEGLGINIKYLREESFLGTAGALNLIDPIPEKPFVVTNGDVIADIRYGEVLDFHELHNSSATMAVKSFELQHPFGVVQTEGVNVIGFEEKPTYKSYINAGIYVLEPESLKFLSGEHCDMPDLFERLQKNNNKTVAYPMHEPWVDLGRPDDLLLINNETK